MKSSDAVVSTNFDEAVQLGWLARIVAAHTPADVGETIAAMVESRLPKAGVSVMWGLQDASRRRSEFTTRPGIVDLLWLAQSSAEAGLQWHPNQQQAAFRLCTLPEQVMLLIRITPQDIDNDCFASMRELLQLAGRHLRRALEWSALKGSHQQLERSEMVQRALFAISDLAGS